MLVVENGSRLAAVDRVVQSSVFRQSDILQRLLRYLAERAFDGTADQLKEYTIGIEALGKSTGYDPRLDSVVRIHVGRLRQKLIQYYQAEGKSDPVLIDLPKGHFKLNFQMRDQFAAEVPPPVAPANQVPLDRDTKPRSVLWLIAALVLVTGYALWSTSRSLIEQRHSAAVTSYWNQAMRDFWKPFLIPGRPVIVSAAYPMFIRLEGAGFYRDPSVESLSQAESSPRLTALRKALGNPAISVRHSYTGAGEANALFMLGRIFTGPGLNVSMTRSEDLTWQQLADNNVVMIGGPRFFVSLLRGLPSTLSYSLEDEGIRILHPNAGEPQRMPDVYVPDSTSQANRLDHGGDPYLYALITHVPGPLGRSDILSFSSNRQPGTLAAVQWLTDPDLARALASKIRKPNGEIPRFFQLVLKVRYQDAVPTDVSLIAHAEIQSPLAH